jgi:16S rRNA (cytidine1402-2'-O)-methyltransferase
MLYIVPTPIGNTEDITMRGLRLLKEVNLVFCENTPTIKKLLWIYEIPYKEKTFIKFTSHDHKHIHHSISLLENQDGILVSEAGTPWLSDPGKMLIIACQKANIPYTILPWATALIPAVIGAWFPTTHRAFAGFLPHKKWRETAIKTMIESEHATFFYESVHRVPRLIEQLEKADFLGMISVSRELSKFFEQTITGNLSTIRQYIKDWKIPLKGEFVIGLYPHDTDEQIQIDDDYSSD